MKIIIKELFRCALGADIATVFALTFFGTIYGIVWLFLKIVVVIK